MADHFLNAEDIRGMFLLIGESRTHLEVPLFTLSLQPVTLHNSAVTVAISQHTRVEQKAFLLPVPDGCQQNILTIISTYTEKLRQK